MTTRLAASQESFTEFFAETEPRLRRALVAAYGPERGREAAAEALAYGWEHWDRVQAMGNPAGYLYRVGQSRTRPRLRSSARRATVQHRDLEFEPGLFDALERLTRRQRLSVVLIHGFGWTMAEVSDLTDISLSSVQTHLQRGLQKLRTDLGDDTDD